MIASNKIRRREDWKQQSNWTFALQIDETLKKKKKIQLFPKKTVKSSLLIWIR